MRMFMPPRSHPRLLQHPREILDIKEPENVHMCLPQASREQLAYPQTKPSARDPHADSYSVGTLGIASINKSPSSLELQLLPRES